MTAAMNTVEWDRIDMLGACLSIHRGGGEIENDIQNRLARLQQEVVDNRASFPWQPFSDSCRLTFLDQDILAMALAPEADSRLGWMFQDLQGGTGGSYPTPALIRELLFLDHSDASLFHERLHGNSPLLRCGLIENATIDSYQSLRPSSRALEHLLGRKTYSEGLPGALHVPVDASWDDLILPENSMRALEDYLSWITLREKVVDEWGGRSTGGPVALFAGPSGTGKSFAAEVISGTLGWPLYRVDLGLMVSKYIGETEKNLNALFDAAHGKNLVLLFDEADSLFGKRGDIRDARDRYANMEVSHLLSRIERHNGPCILTTNLRQHMDPAFARRFQAVVEFPRPDAVSRHFLWKKHLPPKAPLNEDLNLKSTAEEISLTGGQIRNAALQAAYFAAAKNSSISREHIARAVWLELNKNGREVLSGTMGSLSAELAGGNPE